MEAIEYLQSFSKFGSTGGFKPGLDRVSRLLERLDSPEKGLNIIHVGGTNGKGSTIAFLESLYQQEYSVGVYTSPPLERFNERIRFGGREITDREIRKLVPKIKKNIESLDSKWGRPSFFEVVTVLAFLYFAEKQPDLVLMEVGLGGRLDATNVIEPPLATVITSISLEHTQILGNSFRQIAREKGGIIKSGSPLITGVENKEARGELKRISRERGARYIDVNLLFSLEKIKATPEAQTAVIRPARNFCRDYFTGSDYIIGLPGFHQLKNAVLALAVVCVLKEEFPLGSAEIRKGLKNVKWPGRLEIWKRHPLVVLDGAHNLEAATYLRRYLNEIAEEGQRLWLVLAVLTDKDIAGMLSELNNYKYSSRFLLTENRSERSLKPAELYARAQELNINSRKFTDLRRALIFALENRDDDDIICITGSLSTVGEAKNILKEID